MIGDTSMYMPVAPVGNGYNNGGDGMFGGGWMWFLLVWMAMFGWGNNGWGGNGTNSDLQRGFDQASLSNGINNIQTSLCNGFAGVNNAIANGFAQSEIAANARQMADMNQNFALQSSLQQCCCDNRMATAQLGTAISQDGAMTRQAISGGIQSIHDKLCQLEMDGIKQNYENRIAGLQNTIDALRDANQNFRSAASFNALGDRLQASQDAQTNALEQYLAPVPRPAFIVQNPNCCAQNWNTACSGT